jgi:hypothetical protein
MLVTSAVFLTEPYAGSQLHKTQVSALRILRYAARAKGRRLLAKDLVRDRACLTC